MNIAVLIKQVPMVNEIKFDAERKTIIREGVGLLMNSLDRRALTQAIMAREQFGGSITAISMGPAQARDVLAEALATGADRAIHLSDIAFAGADTLATARALTLALKQAGPFDVIFGGRFSIDAETGQVGPEVAEMLGIPQGTNLQAVEFLPAGDTVKVRRETEEGFEDLLIKLPALLTAGEWLNRPLRATPEEITAAKELPIETWSANDLSADHGIFGLPGSPTYVKEVRQMEPARDLIVVPGDDADAAAQQAVDYMLSRGLFTPWERAAAKAPSGVRANTSPTQAVWVVAELHDGRPKNVTLELLGKAGELADQTGGDVVAVVIGSHIGGLADVLASYGADHVLLADDPTLAHFDTERYTAVLTHLVEERRPSIVLFGATVDGRDLAPRLAARLGAGLTGDAIGLEINEERRLVQLKPAFGGNIVAPILTRTHPQMATVRPGVFQAFAPDSSRRAVVEHVPAHVAGDSRVTHVDAYALSGASGVHLDDAEVVVGVGAGVGTPENLPIVHELADVLDGTISSSLRAVANGILPGPLQVGLTGRAIAPRFYVTVGIRGALNHLIGVQKAGTIIAINNDPAAEIFKAADFGIVGSFEQIVPALTKALAKVKPVE